MNNFTTPLIIGLFMFGLINWTYANLEYKGYSSTHNCTGECYEEYIKVHGTLMEQVEARRAEAATDPFSSIRPLWAGCAACHGQEGQGMGAFPKLSGQSAEYIAQRLNAYKNREQIGPMSSTMWAQAGMLSDNDIQTISDFIAEAAWEN